MKDWFQEVIQERRVLMTVETLINVLDKEVTIEVFQAYDNEILFDSSRSRR